MKAQEFKDFLTEDKDRIIKVLESVGVHKIWETGSELRGAPPDNPNHTAISVNVDTLFCRYYKRDETFRGDLIALIQFFRDESFPDTFRFLTSLRGNMILLQNLRKSENNISRLQI
jgi:DNA primase